MIGDKSLDNTGPDQEKSFLERAQDMLEAAVETTVDAVKEHPIAAGAIAAGAAAAVAGVAYGASKLFDKDSAETDPATDS